MVAPGEFSLRQLKGVRWFFRGHREGLPSKCVNREIGVPGKPLPLIRAAITGNDWLHRRVVAEKTERPQVSAKGAADLSYTRATWAEKLISRRSVTSGTPDFGVVSGPERFLVVWKADSSE